VANARAHVLISGRVQGVFFRVETRREALKRKIVGWVRNTIDGKVEAVFEGKKEDVKKMIDFCRKGPSNANVTGVDVKWQDYSGDFEKFNIRRTN
jgi:acylphosphatase